MKVLVFILASLLFVGCRDHNKVDPIDYKLPGYQIPDDYIMPLFPDRIRDDQKPTSIMET